ncbi:MAG: class I SAM-dependent methyltransferase [Acidimicrobiales bacterium]
MADLALLQGSCGTGVDASIELVDAAGGIGAVHRVTPIPHPLDLGSFAVVATFDEEAVGAATRARLVNAGSTGPWVDLPALRTPRGMPGVEAITECPACARARFDLVGRRQGLTMQRCLECGLVMTSPRPAEDHTLVRYGDRYFETEYLPSQEDTAAMMRHAHNLLDVVEPYRTSTGVLYELGVGGGSFLDAAVERGWAVAGSDVNPAAVAHVCSRGHRVEVGNVDHLDAIPEPVRVVVSEMSLEHVRNPDHAIKLAANALRSGGALLVWTVSAEGESMRYEGMASHLVGPAEHLFLFTEESLRSFCTQVGFEVQRVWFDATRDSVGVLAVKP